MGSTVSRCGVKARLWGAQEAGLERKRCYLEHRRQVWGEGEVMWSTRGRCGAKEMLCAAQVWRKGQVMFKTETGVECIKT
jgi:hypothetical protein